MRSTHTDVLAIVLRLVDVPAATSLCLLVIQFKSSDINEARYKAFMHMSGRNEKQPLARIKMINSASLHQDACQSHQKGPLCARIWKRADQTDPTGEASTIDYGWNETENCLEHD